jgi:hypothetical protein
MGDLKSPIHTMMKIEKLLKRSRSFLKLTGLKVANFQMLLAKLETLWRNEVVALYKRPGRNCTLAMGEQLLVLLLYYRFYVSEEMLGAFFGVDGATICRCIKRLEPLLIKIAHIKKTRQLSEGQLHALIIDATESPIERPTHGQRRYYSGKKKQHTVKTEIRISSTGQILNVSRTVPGSVHDFRLLKEGKPLPGKTDIFADSGYQGIDKLRKRACTPFKRTKTRHLTDDEMQFNGALSRIRIRVEHVFRQIKIFKILSERYRNRRKRYNLRFQIIAGLINIKNEFNAALS